jgi:predicted CoA-binding protein
VVTVSSVVSLDKKLHIPYNYTMKNTLIIGATPNPTRYAYRAAQMLKSKGHSIVNVGIKSGEVAGVTIEKPGSIHTDIHTVTLYIGPDLQAGYFDYIVQTNPKRVIFNPGTENAELEAVLKENGIEPVEACTLVMLATGQY